MFLLRKPILALSGNSAVRDALTTTPITRSVVDRFIPGETARDAVAAVTDLRGAGMQVTLDHLGEDTTDRATADATVDAYLEVIAGPDRGRAGGRGRAVGQALGGRPGPARLAGPAGRAAMRTRWPGPGGSPTPPTRPAPG